MDVKIVNLNKNKLLKENKISKEEEFKYFKDYLYLALGLKVIKEHFKLTKSIDEEIDFLCIDESYRIVLVETRYGKDTRLIKSGLIYIDYIKEHLSELKLICNDALGIDVTRNINFNPRLVILTKSFMKYDLKSIEKLPYNIEIINYFFLDNDLVFVKTNQNMDVEISNEFKDNEILNELVNVFINLGEDVSISSYKNVITIRKIKAFSYIVVNSDLILILNNKEYNIRNKNDILKLESKIEKAYDEN